MHSTYRRPIGNDTGKIELIGTTQFIQQHTVQLVPYAGLLPGTRPVPTRHTRATPHFWREDFPQNSRLQNKQDARQYAPTVQRHVGKMRPALLPDRKQWRGYFPQFIINQFGCLIAWPLKLSTTCYDSKNAILSGALRNPCAQIDHYTPGLLKEVVSRDENGVVIRIAEVMAGVAQSGTRRLGDLITIQLLSSPYRQLERV